MLKRLLISIKRDPPPTRNNQSDLLIFANLILHNASFTDHQNPVPLVSAHSIDVIKVLVNAMDSGRSPYCWDFNIMDIPICIICFEIPKVR